jgi:hypothetical protein
LRHRYFFRQAGFCPLAEPLAFGTKIHYTALIPQDKRSEGERMAATVEELTVAYEEDGVEIVKELDKRVLTKGAWATLMYRYQELNRTSGEFGPEKYSIRRYQKVQGDYRPKSKFVISSAKQARMIMEILTEWLPAEEDEA